VKELVPPSAVYTTIVGWPLMTPVVPAALRWLRRAAVANNGARALYGEQPEIDEE